MSQVPPPPPAGPPPAAGGARPPLVTAAAVLLFIAGGFGILGGLLLTTATGLSSIFLIIGILSIAIGAAEIYAGVKCLQGQEQGRILGIVMGGVGAVFALISIGQSPATSVLSLALNGFIIYALVTTAAWFKR